MDNDDDIDSTGTFVAGGEFKRRVNTLRTIAQAEHATVALDTLEATARMNRGDSDNSASGIKERDVIAILEEADEGSTVVHHYQPGAARLSWTQTLLNWFRRN